MKKNTKDNDKIKIFLDKLSKILHGPQFAGKLSCNHRPLWHFFEANFFTDSLPAIFPNHSKINLILGKKTVSNSLTVSNSFFQGFRHFFIINFIKKYLIISTLIKMFIINFFNNRKYEYESAEGRGVEGEGEEDKKRIMVMCFSNGILINPGSIYVDRLNDLVKAIEKEKKLQLYLSTADPLSHNNFFSLIKYPNPIYRYTDYKIIKKSWVHAGELHCFWKQSKGRLDQIFCEEKEIYSIYKPVLDFYFSKELLFLTLVYYETYKKIMAEEDIKLVVLPAVSGIIDNCCLYASDSLGVNSVVVSHGLGIPSFNKNLPDSTKLCVSSRFMQEKTENFGIKRKNIAVTGAVFLENIHQYIIKKPKNNNNLLFLTGPFVDYNILDKETYFSLIKGIFLEFKKLPSLNFIIKVHPNEKTLDDYKKLLSNLKISNAIFKHKGTKGDLYSLINNSSVVVSFGSIAVSEALILKKPSVIIQICKELRKGVFSPITQEKTSGIHIKSVKKLSKTIKSVLYDKRFKNRFKLNRKKFIAKYYGRIDGKASQRVIAIIKKQLKI